MTSPVRTVVHLLRHGEVDNPRGILYGRLPNFVLSGLGHDMADLAAAHFVDESAEGDGAEIVAIISSPLERAQQTAAPLAEKLGLSVTLDDRLIEAANEFEGEAVAGGRGLLRAKYLKLARNPFRPSWGEPYVEVRDRMLAAIDDARDRARGHSAVIVSHQLPIWIARRALTGRRLWHDPRQRECSLASVTSLHYDDDELVSIEYCEPAVELLPQANKVAGA